jgi:hypothetical protein
MFKHIRFIVVYKKNSLLSDPEEQEVNLVWPNLFLIFDCPSSVYTAHDHDFFRTLSKMILLNQYFFTFLLFNACCLFGNISI